MTCIAKKKKKKKKKIEFSQGNVENYLICQIFFF